MLKDRLPVDHLEQVGRLEAQAAIDVLQSGTRREEAMIAADELAAMSRLRRVLTGMDPQNALDLLIGQLKKTRSNAELLMQIMRTTPNR